LIERHRNTEKQTLTIWKSDIIRVREKVLDYNKMQKFPGDFPRAQERVFQRVFGFLKVLISLGGEYALIQFSGFYPEIPPFPGTLTQELHIRFRIFPYSTGLDYSHVEVRHLVDKGSVTGYVEEYHFRIMRYPHDSA
jgi:hypothetical protein